MDKAEHTLIGARHRLNGFELQSEWFPLAANKSNHPLPGFQCGPASDGSRLKLEIDHIEQRLAVQLKDLVAGFESDPRSQGIRFHGDDAQALHVRSAMRGSMAIFVNRLQ